MSDAVEIFTDGACRGNPGPGGWGVVLRYREQEKLLSGGAHDTTNNRMELTAAIEALEALRRPVSGQARHRLDVREERDHPVARRVEAPGLEDRRSQTREERGLVEAPGAGRVAARYRVGVGEGSLRARGKREGRYAGPVRRRGAGVVRQVFLDTETTGLEPELGHRIIEIGGVEMVNRRLTGRRLHHYLQPDREIDDGALEVHGITREFLQDKPRFADVHADVVEFISGAEVVIHNAPFDVAFLDCELARLGDHDLRIENICRVLDSLALARQLHPGQRNGLDALCKRYGIDNSARQLHGALLDAEILADVYMAMTGGQAMLELGGPGGSAPSEGVSHGAPGVRGAGSIPVVRARPEEVQAHARQLAHIDEKSGGRCLWLRLEGG